MNRNDAPWGTDLQEYLDLLGFDAPTLEQQGVSSALWGQGNPQASLVFVLEALQGSEQEQATHLLLKMLQAMGYSLENAYVLFFTLPLEGVLEGLEEQVQNARAVVAFGDQAARLLLGSEVDLSALRTKKLDKSVGHSEFALFVTHHPRELLIHVEQKKEVWEDLKIVMAFLAD